MNNRQITIIKVINPPTVQIANVTALTVDRCRINRLKI